MRLLTLVLTVFCLLANPAYCSTLACDFNNDSNITDADLFILFAYQQIKAKASLGKATLDIPTVQSQARSLLGDQTLTVSRLPSNIDDLENLLSSDVADNDLFILFAFQQIRAKAALKKATLDFPTVEAQVESLLKKKVGIGKFPGTPTGDSSFSSTISGIESD